MSQGRSDQIVNELVSILEAASGIDVRDYALDQNFFDIGMDSLILTQVSIQIERKFHVKVGFRDLFESLGNVSALGAYLASASTVFKDAVAATPVSGPTQAAAAPAPKIPIAHPDSGVASPVGLSLSSTSAAQVAGLLQLFQSQLAMLQQATGVEAQTVPAANMPAVPAKISAVASEAPAKPFGAIARISKDASVMTRQQEEFFKDFVKRYQAKTAKSKEHTQAFRSTHADPRVVTGFKPHLKELIYPLVMNRSKGAELWDLDGNRYVDLTCGFGSNFFGNMPSWLETRLVQQLKSGVEIGPQHELAGKVSAKLTQYIGHDRAAFCNTGSEAVLGAIRIARTVTGRDKIVTFAGSYHGIIDEVIVRATKTGKSMPAAPGIMPNAVGQTIVLDYGVPEAIQAIKENKDNIAAILVESVQSRRPDFRPVDFVKELRRICDDAGILLIFDEIITGFRKGRHGAQGFFGVQADLATYGKVIGGGISIGVIAGKRKYMDALDGGHWQFGDGSVPEVGVTYFAGTFVRHPLALAAMDAVLDFLQSSPASLAADLDKKADAYVAMVNKVFAKHKAPWHYTNWGSMMKLNPSEEFANLELLVYLLRYRGVHTWDGFPNFLTLAHSDADINFIVNAIDESVQELAAAGFLTHSGQSSAAGGSGMFGRDAAGGRAAFIADPQNPGSYIPAPK